MLILVATFLFLVLVFFRHTKGPVWAMAIGWLVAIGPLATYLISYGSFKESGLEYELTLIGFLSCFVLGAAIFRLKHTPGENIEPVDIAVTDDVERILPTARLCWWLGIIGSVLLCYDFFLKGGEGLSDLASLRATITQETGASIYAQLASVLTWACLYCYIFALVYWQQLSRTQLVRYLLPVGGYFLISLLSAGRQASFQIVLVTVLLLLLLRKRQKTSIIGKGGRVFLAGLSALMIAYMGYVAVARTNTNEFDDRSELLASLFDYSPSPPLAAVERGLDVNVKSTLNEALVYFTNSVPGFKSFLTVKFPDYYYGTFTVPFVMRQLEPVTHISVIGALNAKIAAQATTGNMATGWTTAISAYILDFGMFGACIFLFLQGYYSEYTWDRGRTNGGFHDVVIATMLLMSAVLMPISPGSSDTGNLFLWGFCILAKLAAKYPPPLMAREDGESGKPRAAGS